MREILFRGKRINNGEWCEGYLSKSRDENKQLKLCIDYEEKGVMCSSIVIPETVGQYTGFTDKNGKRIFEMDIVRCCTGRICKVIFFISPYFSGFDLVPIGGFEAPPPHKCSLFADAEIIGNIHDNPNY